MQYLVILLLILPLSTPTSLLETMVLRRTEKYVDQSVQRLTPMIVMPIVKRTVDYLDAALRSVDRARGEMSVILVNGTPNFDPGWCEHFECVDSPPVPENVFKNVIAMDKRGDDKDFLKWRTKEAWDAMFAMRHFLKSRLEYMIWLQDDVFVHDLYNIPDHDVTCLRTGKDYCGLVAFKFKRWVVVEFIDRIEKYYSLKPIDWILDDLRADLGIVLHRLGKVDHMGKKSSNNRVRPVD